MRTPAPALCLTLVAPLAAQAGAPSPFRDRAPDTTQLETPGLLPEPLRLAPTALTDSGPVSGTVIAPFRTTDRADRFGGGAHPIGSASPLPLDRDKSFGRFYVAFGGGRFEHTTEGQPSLSDDTTAGYFRIGFEAIGDNAFGGGLRVDAMAADNDLFQDSGGTVSDASDGELFLHLTGVFGADDVIVPLRFGLFLRGYRLEENASGAQVTWGSAGGRIELAPEFLLVHGGAIDWGLFGTIGAGYGIAVVDHDLFADDFDTTVRVFDVAAGTRLSFEHVELEVGFLFRTQRYPESDPIGILSVAEIETEFRGLLIGGSVVF